MILKFISAPLLDGLKETRSLNSRNANTAERAMSEIDFFREYGYRCDREQLLRKVSSGLDNSLALEAANQIAHLKSALKELLSIVKIHQESTNNNFAWAEVEEAEIALGEAIK